MMLISMLKMVFFWVTFLSEMGDLWLWKEYGKRSAAFQPARQKPLKATENSKLHLMANISHCLSNWKSKAGISMLIFDF